MVVLFPFPFFKVSFSIPFLDLYSRTSILGPLFLKLYSRRSILRSSTLEALFLILYCPNLYPRASVTPLPYRSFPHSKPFLPMGGFSKYVPAASNIHFDIDNYINRICLPSQTHKFPTPIARFLGWRKSPAKPIGNILVALYAFLGAFTGLIVVGATYRYSPLLKEDNIPVLFASLVRLSPTRSSRVNKVAD